MDGELMETNPVPEWSLCWAARRRLLLARALTGGGSLFCFAVFAAYGICHLIGAAACGVGLFVSALAVFGLASGSPMGRLRLKHWPRWF
jgi:hypothetical protein